MGENTKMNGQRTLLKVWTSRREGPKATGKTGAFRLRYLALSFAFDSWVVLRSLHVLHSPTDFPLVPNAL